MIIIHDPEPLAACHQTWICDVEVHIPGSTKVYVYTVEAKGIEPPLTGKTYLSLTRRALDIAQKCVNAMSPERKS